MSKAQTPRDDCRWFQLGGITIQVGADRPITRRTFAPKFDAFEVGGPGSDNICLHHRFGLPDLDGRDLGRQVYRKMPWVVFEKADAWFYLGSVRDGNDTRLARFAEFDPEHSRGTIWSPEEDQFMQGGL